MLNFQEFVEAVAKEAQQIVGDDYKVAQKVVTKLNGVILTAVTITPKDEMFEGCIYVDYVYENMYCQGEKTVSSIAQSLMDAFFEESFYKEIDVKKMESWEWVREHLFCKLIHTEMNKELLKTIPHREHLDLSVVYYIYLDKEHRGTILVEDYMAEYWEKTEEDLYQQTLMNVQEKGNLDVTDVKEIIAKRTGINPEVGGLMYVVRDLNVPFGAVHMINDKAILKIQEKLGKEFIVLPSSVFELIVVPIDEYESRNNLATMVKNINDTSVLPEERLSYHVYGYMDGNMEILI